jgi:hypothetical protein
MDYVLAGAAIAAFFISGCRRADEDAPGAGKRSPAFNAGEPAKAPSPPKCPAPSDQLKVTLDGRMGAENAGILMARERGFVRDVGLYVWIGTPGSPEAT